MNNVISFGGDDPIAGDGIEVTYRNYDIREDVDEQFKTFRYVFTSADIALGRNQAILKALNESVDFASPWANPPAIINPDNPDSFIINTDSYENPIGPSYGRCTVYNINCTYAQDYTSGSSIPSLKTNSSYQLALGHFDDKGRAFPLQTDKNWIVNTVPKIDPSTFPDPNTIFIPVIVPSFAPGTVAPEGAYLYQWFITENTKFQNWVDMYGTYVDSESTGTTMVIDVTEWFTYVQDEGATQANYEYSEGDRAIIYQKNTESYINLDTQIKGLESDGSSWKLSMTIPSDFTATNGDTIRVEAYTPRRSTIDESSKVFYACTERRPIQNGEYLGGNLNITSGDNYLKTRINFVEDPSFSDYYPSKYYNFGTPRSYYDTPEGVSYESRIRYSREYVFGSQINGINRFYPESFRDYDYIHGKIQYLTNRGNRLVCVQERNTGYIGVLRNIVETAEAQQSIAYTTDLLSDINYTTGLPTGIGDAIKSYVEFSGVVYFLDPHREIIVRAGVDMIRDIGGNYSKEIRNVIQRNKESGDISNVIGVYDRDYNEVLFYFPEDQITRVFSEELDKWARTLPIGEWVGGFSSDRVLYMSQVDDIWEVTEESVKANYFGTQYYASITFLANQNPDLNKNFQTLATKSNNLMVSPSIVSNLGFETNIINTDYDNDYLNNIEGLYTANIPRSLPDPINGDIVKGSYTTIKLQAITPDIKLFKVVITSSPSLPYK